MIKNSFLLRLNYFLFYGVLKSSGSPIIFNKILKRSQTLFLLVFVLSGCKQQSTNSMTSVYSNSPTPSPTQASVIPLPSPEPSTVLSSTEILISWDANREKAVNSTHGGYKVYYSQTPGFELNSATMIDVPYVSGPLAPTSTKLTNLVSGTYYLRIIAYSGLTLPGSSTFAVSDPSPEVSFSVSVP